MSCWQLITRSSSVVHGGTEEFDGPVAESVSQYYPGEPSGEEGSGAMGLSFPSEGHSWPGMVDVLGAICHCRAGLLCPLGLFLFPGTRRVCPGFPARLRNPTGPLPSQSVGPDRSKVGPVLWEPSAFTATGLVATKRSVTSPRSFSRFFQLVCHVATSRLSRSLRGHSSQRPRAFLCDARPRLCAASNEGLPLHNCSRSWRSWD
jgi:hypothetical protein